MCCEAFEKDIFFIISFTKKYHAFCYKQLRLTQSGGPVSIASLHHNPVLHRANGIIFLARSPPVFLLIVPGTI